MRLIESQCLCRDGVARWGGVVAWQVSLARAVGWTAVEVRRRQAMQRQAAAASPAFVDAVARGWALAAAGVPPTYCEEGDKRAEH